MIEVKRVTIEVLPEDVPPPSRLTLVEDESVVEPDGPVSLEFIKNEMVGEHRFASLATMLEFAKGLGNRAGMRSMVALLRQQQLIPMELGRFAERSLFMGSVATNAKHELCVPGIFPGPEWQWRWHRLNGSYQCRYIYLVRVCE